MTIGQIVALTSCPAWEQPANEQTTVSGLWIVDERIFPDRSCGQFEPGFMLVPDDNGIDHFPPGHYVFIDSDTLREQVNPQSHGRMLAEDRRQELAAECDSVQYGD